MKYYTTTTEFNCGIDLHAKQMYACIMDRQGKILVHQNIKGNDFGHFLKRFRIPPDIDENSIEARYENGFLYLRLLRCGSRLILVE